MKFEAYRDGGDPKRKIQRCWSVVENDGSEDGRLVGSTMTEEDARRIAGLLNQDLVDTAQRKKGTQR